MSKKKNTKSVLITILLSVVILAAVTVLGARYVLPTFVQSADGYPELLLKINFYAIRIFPLLIGVVFIVIASMMLGSKDEEVDEEDLLPPNSYDQQLFEKPADDPTVKSSTENQKSETVTAEPSDDDFFAILNSDDISEPAPVSNTESVESVAKNTLDDDIFGDADDSAPESSVPDNFDTVNDIIFSEQTETQTPVEQPTVVSSESPVLEVSEVPEPPAGPEVSETSVPSAENADDERLTSIEERIDKLADVVTKLGTSLSGEPEVAVANSSETSSEALAVDNDRLTSIEKRINTLTDAISVLSTSIANGSVSIPDTSAPVAEVSDGEKVINDIDPNDPIALMRVEFESSRENGYDVTYVVTNLAKEDIPSSLDGLAYAYSANGKTVICIPFLSQEEAEKELAKAGIDCEPVFIQGGQEADFDQVIGAQLA